MSSLYRLGLVVVGAAAVFLIGWVGSADGENNARSLRIGATSSLGTGRSPAEKKAAENLLKNFIKDETGFDDEIVDEKDWRALAGQLTKGTVQLGAFHGYEFAWAKQRYLRLHPLALAVNEYTYPVVYVVTRKDSKFANLAELRGQSIVLLADGPGDLARLFVDREVQALSQQPKTFFSRIVLKKNAEDLIDDVLDGTEQAGAVERVSLEAYKRRKPGRFNQLKKIAQSPAVLPGVIAYYDKNLDEATLTRFRNGLLSANRKEVGQTLLTMFHLTSFEAVPANFRQMLVQTQKTFPAPQDVK